MILIFGSIIYKGFNKVRMFVVYTLESVLGLKKKTATNNSYMPRCHVIILHLVQI